MSHVEALAAGAAVAPPSVGTSAGTVVGAALGGALVVVAVLVIAIRYKVVSAQLNETTVSAWNPGQRKKKVRVPDFDIGLNQVQQNPAFSFRAAKPIAIVPV